ncbi:MAG: lysine--tRNA ligase, partial [Planctomycetota bacterium]|nr:lysine--tRNA ligase [Planctomycetota bacterium]
SPEFTMLELYQAYADYTDMMKVVEALFSQVTLSVFGSSKITYQGNEYDLTPPYPRLSYTALFKENTGFDVWDEERVKKAYSEKTGVEKSKVYEHWHAVDKLFEWHCEEALKGPVFIIDYPVEMSPLAKQKKSDPRLVERFECFLAGMEVANAFTELNDPLEQRKRFEEQLKRAKETEIPRVLDEDYVEALSYGMPPAGGLGIGIDRLIMFFTNTATIRDVILFPLLKAKE